MAATALTREAFVTGEASAKIDGSGKSAVNSGELILGVQLGCQVDLSQGGNFSPGGDIGAGVNIGNGIGIGLGGLADIDPSISVNILPAAWQHHNNGARQKCAPSDISTAGLSESGKGGDSGSDKVTPIVMPYGQSPPPKEDSDSTSTSTTPTPILPAGG